MPDWTPPPADVLDVQSGVLDRAQWQSLGLPDETVARRVAQQRWTRLHRGVVLTRPGQPSYEQQVWAALLAVGGSVVASHETALWLACPQRDVPPLVHVAVLDGRAVSRPSGVRVHHLPDLRPDRVLWQAAPPRVRPEHSIVDLERLCESATDVVGLVSAVVRERITTVPRLAAVVAARPRVRWRRHLELLLADLEAGAQSPLELEDLRNDRAHGLPAGLRQVPVRRAGRRDWLDVLYEGPPLVRGVGKELDGRWGHEGEARWRDMDRDNAAAVRRQVALRFGWHDVLGRPCRTAALTFLVLADQGWPGRLRSCSRACSAREELRQLYALSRAA